jgi:thiol-disulfide isomerase/thioredoxin
MSFVNGKTVSLVVIGICILLYFNSKPPEQVPDIALESNIDIENYSSDPCKEKERCLAVYLASWCPACKSAVPIIKEIRKFALDSEEVGMKIILGRDEPENLEDLADEIEGEVFFDEDDRFFSAMRARAIPHWWVWDKNGKILVDFSGSFSGGSLEDLVNHVIDEELKLGDYM